MLDVCPKRQRKRDGIGAAVPTTRHSRSTGVGAGVALFTHYTIFADPHYSLRAKEQCAREPSARQAPWE
jgi:hypothetical protein